jgi:hypothetical protein
MRERRELFSSGRSPRGERKSVLLLPIARLDRFLRHRTCTPGVTATGGDGGGRRRQIRTIRSRDNSGIATQSMSRAHLVTSTLAHSVYPCLAASSAAFSAAFLAFCSFLRRSSRSFLLNCGCLAASSAACERKDQPRRVAVQKELTFLASSSAFLRSSSSLTLLGSMPSLALRLASRSSFSRCLNSLIRGSESSARSTSSRRR